MSVLTSTAVPAVPLDMPLKTRALDQLLAPDYHVMALVRLNVRLTLLVVSILLRVVLLEPIAVVIIVISLGRKPLSIGCHCSLLHLVDIV
jgi:hypothetical protein